MPTHPSPSPGPEAACTARAAFLALQDEVRIAAAEATREYFAPVRQLWEFLRCQNQERHVARARSRAEVIGRALDHALEKIAGLPPLAQRELSMEDALAVVKASHYQCGPVAQAAAEWLRAHGVRDVVCHCLGGHFVLRDRRTGLLHDLERPCGVAREQELPEWQRVLESTRCAHPRTTEEVFRPYAQAWLAQRECRRAAAAV